MLENTPDQNPTNERTSPSEIPVSQNYTVPDGRPSIDLRATDRPLWTGWDLLLIVILTLVLTLFLSAFALIAISAAKGFSSRAIAELAKDPRILIPVQTLTYLAVFWCMVVMVKRGQPISFWPAINWNWPKRWYAFVGGGMALTLVIGILSKVVTMPKQVPIDEMMKTTTNAYIIMVFGIFIAPLLEELFFRGMLYPLACERVLTVVGAIALEMLLLLPAVFKKPRSGWLVLMGALLAFNLFLIVLRMSGQHTKLFRAGDPSNVGKLIGICVTAFGFAMIHGAQLNSAFGPLLALFIVGLVLTGVRAKTGSVAATVMMHVGYNGIQFIVLWFVTDHFRHMEKALGAFIFCR